MAIKRDRKGMISMMDAMIFITLISIVSVSLFAFAANEQQDDPLAKTVCEDFLSIKLKASDLLETEDSDIYPVSELIAADMASGGTEKVFLFVKNTIEDLLPKKCGYLFSFDYRGNHMELSREGNLDEKSQYSKEIEIHGNEKISVELKIV